jgi:RNA polymerase-binding transcription factor DksA
MEFSFGKLAGPYQRVLKNAFETPSWLIVHLLLASALMFCGILLRISLKLNSQRVSYNAHISICMAIQLPVQVRPPRWKQLAGWQVGERMANSKAQEEDGSSENEQLDTDEFGKSELLFSSVEGGDQKLPSFLDKQKSKLLQFRDSLLDLMTGVLRDTLRSRAEDNEASGLGMHQADAGSDAYDRDFALNLLSQEQDALYEIEEAIKRVDAGTYGIAKCRGNQFHKLDLRPSHLQDLRSNARLKLRNDKRRCTSGSLSNPFSAQPKMTVLKEKKIRPSTRKISF